MRPLNTNFVEVAGEASLPASIGSSSLVAMLSEHEVAKYTEHSVRGRRS